MRMKIKDEKWDEFKNKYFEFGFHIRLGYCIDYRNRTYHDNDNKNDYIDIIIGSDHFICIDINCDRYAGVYTDQLYFVYPIYKLIINGFIEIIEN